MNKEKQIDEIFMIIADVACGDIAEDECDAKDSCSYCRAERLYNAGYRKQSEWISVEERLPDVCGMPVLMVAENEYGQTNVVKGFTDYTCPIVFNTNEMEYYGIWHAWKVTHWMPLPEPPDMKGGE